MARIVHFTWSPTGSGYGYLRQRHPTLPQYEWVEWLPARVAKDGTTGGYYRPRRDFRELGVALFAINGEASMSTETIILPVKDDIEGWGGVS